MRPHYLIFLACCMTSVTAHAADYGPPPYTPPPPVLTEDTGLRGSIGIRYWYSQSDATLTNECDCAWTADNRNGNSGEIFFDLIDPNYGAFFRGALGLGLNTGGTSNVFGIPYDTVNNTRFGYITADAGYRVGSSQDGNVTGELFVGYQFLNDRISTSFAGLTDAYDAQWHAIRLGVGASVDLGDRFNISADAAVIPWAYNTASNLDSSYAYGGQAQIMADYRFTDSFSAGIGGRYWLLKSKLDDGFDLEYQRYGALLQGKYSF